MGNYLRMLDPVFEERLGEALRGMQRDESLKDQVEVELFLGGSVTSDVLSDYWSHSGDVHAANEFGFDLRNPDDAKRWTEITGETPVVAPEATEQSA